jgi:LacI family transcriptional regulator
MTIKEIAEKAEVSVGTVDRVLHNRGDVSKKTREKVLRIVQEGNYEPNLFARQLVLNKAFTIASLLPKHRKDDYWAYPEQGIRQSVEEVKSFGIRNQSFLFEEENEQDFEKVAKKVLQSRPDGLLLAPVIYEKARWLAAQCEQERIPLVLIDSDLPGSSKLASIGQNAYQSGKLAAKLLHFSGSNPDICVTNITHRNENNDVFKQRKKGFLSYFEEHSIPVQIKEVNLKVEDGNFKKQLGKLAVALQEGDAVFVPDSKIHWLAGEVHAQGKSGKIRMVGYDLIEKNKYYLQTNTIDFLINQKPELQGYLGIQSLYKFIVLKQQVQERVFIPIEIVTKENLEFIS